jgi:hypothetical protein
VATDIRAFARQLKGFDDRRVVLKTLRTAIRKPFPAVKAAIKANALETLPKGGKLNAWVAAVKVTLSVKISTARSAGVTIKGGRNSVGGRSDVSAINRGRVRAPSWGRRGGGAWHTVQVKPGFFSDPVTESTLWREEIDQAFDDALNTIRRG